MSWFLIKAIPLGEKGEGLAETLGETEEEGETESEMEDDGDVEAEGETDADLEEEGETEADGEGDFETEEDGDTDEDGETEEEGEGEGDTDDDGDPVNGGIEHITAVYPPPPEVIAILKAPAGVRAALLSKESQKLVLSPRLKTALAVAVGLFPENTPIKPAVQASFTKVVIAHSIEFEPAPVDSEKEAKTSGVPAPVKQCAINCPADSELERDAATLFEPLLGLTK